MKIIYFMILIIITLFVIWFFKKGLAWAYSLPWPMALKLIFYGLILYLLDASGLFVGLAIIQGIEKSDADLLLALSFIILIYTVLFVIINLFMFHGLSEKEDAFFKKLQSIFETALILLTINMLLATIASVISKSLQMTILTNILMFYMPFVPIVGSLKIKFSN